MEYEVSMNVNITSNLPRVRIDKNKIHRVVDNLIDNALKFSPQKGGILINAGMKNQEFMISSKRLVQRIAAHTYISFKNYC